METLRNNLEKKGYIVSIFKTCEQATKYLNENIDGVQVGIGGSMTVKELGLYKSLNQHNEIFWHWENKDNIPQDEIFKKASFADVYITSANAVAKTGEIVNIDGACNRVSASVFGHKKVYFIIGKNKIVSTCDEAISRARNVAAPKNAIRLNRNTPCAINKDKCYDCNSPERICKNLSLLLAKPSSCEFEIIIIEQELGY